MIVITWVICACLGRGNHVTCGVSSPHHHHHIITPDRIYQLWTVGRSLNILYRKYNPQSMLRCPAAVSREPQLLLYGAPSLRCNTAMLPHDILIIVITHCTDMKMRSYHRTSIYGTLCREVRQIYLLQGDIWRIYQNKSSIFCFKLRNSPYHLFSYYSRY